MNFMQAIGYKFELGDHLEIVNEFNNSDDNSVNSLKIPDEFAAAPAVTTELPKDPYWGDLCQQKLELKDLAKVAQS